MRSSYPGFGDELECLKGKPLIICDVKHFASRQIFLVEKGGLVEAALVRRFEKCSYPAEGLLLSVLLSLNATRRLLNKESVLFFLVFIWL